MGLFLLFLLVAIGLGIAGFTISGFFWLLIIGIVLFLLDLVFGGIRMGRRHGGRVTR